MMSSGGKECELPTADSCAIMEGEDAEDDLMDLTKKSFFTKIKSFSREVSNSSLHQDTHTYSYMATFYASCHYQCVFRGHRMDLTQFRSSRHLHASKERRKTLMRLKSEDEQILLSEHSGSVKLDKQFDIIAAGCFHGVTTNRNKL